jgi:serine/threonine protein phosphatase 1
MLRFRRTRSKSARVAQVPEHSRVYAIGDIHGCAHLLDIIHRVIRQDASDAPARRVVVYLGDYVDRGPESRRVLDMLTENPLPGFESVFLAGNHDAWMRDFLGDASVGWGWLANGGDSTILSYGVGLSTRTAGLEETRQALAKAVPEMHRGFLADLRLWHVEGDYTFVHAGIRPGLPLDRQHADDVLWIREDFLDCEDDHGCVVVHGHTITPEPEILPNRIGIDTGAFATGRLTCLVLEGATRRLLFT